MAYQFKTRKQFATDLGISARTLRRRLKNLEIGTSGKLLSPLQQEKIRLALGCPPDLFRMPASSLQY